MTRKRILVIIAVVAVLAATALYAGWFRREEALQGSSTVEARNIRVGSKVGGRLKKVLVREGDTVEPGQVLVTFDDKELQAALAQAQANAEKARRGFRPEEIAEARAAAAQAKAEYNLRKSGYRKEEIAAAEAHSQQAQATLAKLERGSRREDVELARAAYAYEQARYRERQVLAPAAATVEVLDVRPGDLVPPNSPVATLLERDQIYVRVYIPETQIGRVQLGQRAEVRVDPFPNQVFAGSVEQINQQSEFLPRNVQTREERVHQVFGVKVRISDPSGRIRAGMAADVKFKAGS